MIPAYWLALRRGYRIIDITWFEGVLDVVCGVTGVPEDKKGCCVFGCSLAQLGLLAIKFGVGNFLEHRMI